MVVFISLNFFLTNDLVIEVFLLLFSVLEQALAFSYQMENEHRNKIPSFTEM